MPIFRKSLHFGVAFDGADMWVSKLRLYTLRVLNVLTR